MQKVEMISVDEFCFHHKIELTFIQSLHASGLIEISIISEKEFVHANQLQSLEKLVRLYYEMDINMEGLETITYLLQRMNAMQEQILILNKKLSKYEPI